MSTAVSTRVAVTESADDALPLRPSAWQSALAFCRRQPLGAIGLAIVLVMFFAGVCGERPRITSTSGDTVRTITWSFGVPDVGQ